MVAGARNTDGFSQRGMVFLARTNALNGKATAPSIRMGAARPRTHSSRQYRRYARTSGKLHCLDENAGLTTQTESRITKNMTRNQKIAIGCGSVGCLGLIVVIFAGGLFYWMRFVRTAPSDANYNSSYNTNSNANSNSNNSYSAALMSDDEKHRLFQAAGMTKDTDLIVRVLKKLGMMTELGAPTGDYEQFLEDHADWSRRNSSFI